MIYSADRWRAIRWRNAIHVSTYIRVYPMLTLYIADAEKDVSMKNLSPKEAIAILSDMKIDISVPKAAVTQRKRNTALDMAINALNCSEIPNNSDTISRQAVTKFLNDWLSCLFENCHKQSASDLKMIIKDFKNLPSAQPDIIRCPDCYYNDGTAYCELHFRNVKAKDFCSWAERREDEAD